MKRSPFIPLLALLLVMPNLRAQGLGGVSSCAQAPQIAAAAVAFALQNNTGLNSRQASAVVTTVVRHASESAPYLVDAICTAAMNSLQQTVLQTASQGQTPQGNLSHDEVALLPPEEAVATPDGYRKMAKAVVQGAIEGAVSSGLGAEGLQQLIAAVTVSIVKGAAVQASLNEASSQNSTTDPTHGLPMDTVEEAKNVTALIVSTIAQVARTAGFSDKEISTAIDRAAAQAVATAQNINANQVAGQVANEVASQVAGQLANQVATAVAAEVLKHDTPSSQQGGNDDGDAPYYQNNSPMTLPTAPGQPINPGVNTPPTGLNPPDPPPPASPGGPS